MRHGRLILVSPTHHELTFVYVGWPNNEFGTYRQDVTGDYSNIFDLTPELTQHIDAGKRVSALGGTDKLRNYYR